MSKRIANIEVDENQFNSTNHTENLQLPQFIATDKPGWLTDFNGAMEVIDEAAGVLQDQITEQFEDLESVHTQLDRIDDDINNPETGVRQVLHDTQTRVTDLEATVGDESHGLVKDVSDLQQDMVETNTMAVKSNAQLGSVINLLCNKYSTSAQYSQGAYVYTVNDDGSLNFLRCTQTTHGAFNPDKWEDVTEKLISALDNSGGGGSQYVLPIAGDADDPDAVLGGVIIGEGLSIDENGVLSRTVTPTEGIGPDYYASQVRAGLVRPNTEAGLNVNSANGVISIIIDDNTMEFTNDGKLKAKPDTSRFAQGQGISLSNESVPSISVRLAENSNLDFDGQGRLRAILPASAYEIVQGNGIVVTTDAQNNTKTISMTQASTNTLGGVRPKSDSFAFESYDPEHPENKKMTIQLKDKGGLTKQDGVGLSVKVDGTTIEIDQTTGELKATGGGGGGTTYSAGDGINITNDEISVKADPASNNAVKVTSAGVKVSFDNLTIHPFTTDGPLRVSTKNERFGGIRMTQGFNELLDAYRVDTAQPGKYLNLNDNLSREIFRRYTKGRLIPTKVTFSEFVAPEQIKYLGSFGYIYNDGEKYGTLGGIVVELSGDITDPDNAPTITGPTFAVGDTLFQLKPRTAGLGYNTSYTVRGNLDADLITLVPLKCKTTFSASLIAELFWSSDYGEWDVKLKDNINLSTYLEKSEDSDLELTDFAKKASFSKNDEIPYINIYNGYADATDYADVGGYSAEAYDRLTVPSNLYGRRCMLFFPFSLYIMPNVADNPFDDANQFTWTGKLITATYTLGYGDMYGEAATVGTFVPFYERTMVLGSDYVSGNSGGSVITTSDGATLGDWLVLDYDPNRPGGGGTDPSAVGNVRNKYQSVELIPSDARDILLFVTIRAVDLTSGTIQQWTSRVTPSGTPIFRPHGLMGIVPID